MTKAIVKTAAEFKRLREKLEFPAWVRSPITYPCAFVWAWVNDGGAFQGEYIYLEDFIHLDTREAKLQQIVEVVAKSFGLDAATVVGLSRHRKISDARAIICHEARQRAYTFKEVGAVLNRTHKSVYVMEAKYYDMCRYDKDFASLAKTCAAFLAAADL